ncbi:MAG: hypothetical protein ACFWT5_03910 [Pseudomonas helleri]
MRGFPACNSAAHLIAGKDAPAGLTPAGAALPAIAFVEPIEHDHPTHLQSHTPQAQGYG